MTILVVDDDGYHRFVIERTLSPVGHELRFAASGKEALELLDGVDLVLLDYRLPDMTGMDVLLAMRAAETTASVVMVTAMGSEGLAVEAMRLGAVDYVVKDTDYVARLPHVLERAWRNHDVARRAKELQRLAVLVHCADDLPSIYEEILRGARELLRAGSAALFVVNDEGSVEMLAGDADGSSTMAARVASVLTPRAGGFRSHVDDRSLIVPLPGHGDERLGALAVWEKLPRQYLAEELLLAETFAAFAGTALADAARLELERSLVARLQETLDLRRSLVMSLSHELRTPLTCVVGFAETLLGNWDRLDDRARYDCIGAIRDNATELRSLVEQLLDFGALEAGRLVATPAVVDLAVEVDTALQALAPLFTDRTVTSEVRHLEVRADPVLLRRTLSNLLSNAAKYAGPDAPVTVRAVEEAEVVRVEVVDKGIGMTAEEASRAFEPFWRSVGAQLNATRGSGIGLALVREYVRLMGGNVAVEAAPGQGARFSFTLPKAGD
ncbi:MAG TPA: ATP-binding protein [Acidimicrobiales bacterium]|nr:ATP-binding protein [Acidimicrobiales bacterium]